uniref:ER membrane protein complex subunit 3 n=1 Tax=Lotharella oceanica TaxID=641309 RepID=A0A7S2TP13_9EUKA|mmetsp:Transcript_22950/g.43127  ORF Transcript_22950/g.43127 Transcript_22950/m.43127 type:complete len:276 (+) Transcript_22950:3-830(+)
MCVVTLLSGLVLAAADSGEAFDTMGKISADADRIMLDPSIRDWVLVPILIVMFLQGVIREYMSVLLKDPKKTELKTLESMSQLQRSKRLRANAHNIPLEAYEMRKRYFVEKAFKAPEQKEGEMPQLPQQDPTAMMGMLKQNMGMMMIPNMLLMGWTSYFFSGFVIVRLPFSLTAKFKPMLQRGIQLTTLDVSYVSSLSWYFMLFMGFRGLFSVVLGANSATDQAKLMQQQVQGPAGPIQDFNKLNEAEKTELEIHHHEWVTPSAESRFKEAHNDR